MRYKAASLLLLAVGFGLLFSSMSTQTPAYAVQTITQVGSWVGVAPGAAADKTNITPYPTGLLPGDLIVTDVGANNSSLPSDFGPEIPLAWENQCSNAANFRILSGPWIKQQQSLDRTAGNAVYNNGTLNVSGITSVWRNVNPATSGAFGADALDKGNQVSTCVVNNQTFSSVTSVTATSVTPSQTGDLAIYCLVKNSNAAVTITGATATWTKGGEVTGTAYGHTCASAPTTTSAISPTFSWTGNASGVLHGILLKAAPSVTTTTTSTTTSTSTTTTTTAPTTTTTVCTFCGTKKNAVYLRQHDVENIRGDVLFGGAIVIALAAASLVTGLYRTSK